MGLFTGVAVTIFLLFVTSAHLQPASLKTYGVEQATNVTFHHLSLNFSYILTFYSSRYCSSCSRVGKTFASACQRLQLAHESTLKCVVVDFATEKQLARMHQVLFPPHVQLTATNTSALKVLLLSAGLVLPSEKPFFHYDGDLYSRDDLLEWVLQKMLPLPQLKASEAMIGSFSDDSPFITHYVEVQMHLASIRPLWFAAIEKQVLQRCRRQSPPFEVCIVGLFEESQADLIRNFTRSALTLQTARFVLVVYDDNQDIPRPPGASNAPHVLLIQNPDVFDVEAWKGQPIAVRNYLHHFSSCGGLVVDDGTSSFITPLHFSHLLQEEPRVAPNFWPILSGFNNVLDDSWREWLWSEAYLSQLVIPLKLSMLRSVCISNPCALFLDTSQSPTPLPTRIQQLRSVAMYVKFSEDPEVSSVSYERRNALRFGYVSGRGIRATKFYASLRVPDAVTSVFFVLDASKSKRYLLPPHKNLTLHSLQQFCLSFLNDTLPAHVISEPDVQLQHSLVHLNRVSHDILVRNSSRDLFIFYHQPTCGFSKSLHAVYRTAAQWFASTSLNAVFATFDVSRNDLPSLPVQLPKRFPLLVAYSAGEAEPHIYHGLHKLQLLFDWIQGVVNGTIFRSGSDVGHALT